MTTHTLPGTIPGLLRRGAPVIEDGRSAVYLGADKHGYHYVADLTPGQGCGTRIARGPMLLDLSDPAGRWMAAVWALWRPWPSWPSWPALGDRWWAAHANALRDRAMSDDQITTLRDGCLALAGVSA